MNQKIINNFELKNAVWLIGGKVIQMVLSLVVSIWMARYLGPSDFGLINYGNSYTSFFMAFCTLGLNSIIIKEFVDLPDNIGETLGTALTLRIISSFLSAMAIMVIVSILDYGEKITIIVVALSSISLIFHAVDTFDYWFQFHYNSKVTAISALCAYIVTTLYRFVLLVRNKNVLWFAAAMSVDYVVMGIILIVSYKTYCGPKLSFSWVCGKRMLKKSYHYILSGMMVAIYGQTDKLMLKQMLNESSVGYYSVASSICNMWVFVLSAIINSMYPTILRLHRENKQAYEKKNRQLYAIVFYMSAFVSLALCIFGGIGIKILYGDAYLPAMNPLRIITWYTAFSYLGVARNAWIVCEGKQKYLKYIYFCAAVMNVLMNLAMIPKWGSSGAALASLITQIMTSILLPCCFTGLRENAKMMIEAMKLQNIT